MFKKLSAAIVVAALAVGSLMAFGLPLYTSQAGTKVLATTPVNVERITIVQSTGSAVFSVYNATSATGAVALNLVASVTVTAATANLQLDIFGTFPKGLVVSTAGNANTVTAFATAQFIR